jgi:hypothetical protein
VADGRSSDPKTQTLDRRLSSDLKSVNRSVVTRIRFVEIEAFNVWWGSGIRLPIFSQGAAARTATPPFWGC